MTESADWSDLETQLQETRAMLEEIEQRFAQIKGASIAKQELEAQRSQLRSQLQEIDDSQISHQKSKIRRPKSINSVDVETSRDRHHDHLKTELQEHLQSIGDRLEQIEAELESRLIAWSSLREIFWQIVRFGGLGVMIGVILKSCTG